ncbi:hypothetical protein KGY64_01565 [Candidatus Bipolaricaulota bacterium]|nr:hypothetical protein [Candidatus Bipolaricaulota bacterium]
MKWGKNSNNAAHKLTELVGRVAGVRGISVLLTIVAFSLLVGATFKWG